MKNLKFNLWVLATSLNTNSTSGETSPEPSNKFMENSLLKSEQEEIKKPLPLIVEKCGKEFETQNNLKLRRKDLNFDDTLFVINENGN